MLLISAVVLTRYIVLSRANRQIATNTNGRYHSYSYTGGRSSTGGIAPEDRHSASHFSTIPRPTERPRSPFYRFSPPSWELDARESRGYGYSAPASPKPVDIPRFRGEYRFPEPPREASPDSELMPVFNDFKIPLTEPDTFNTAGLKSDTMNAARFSVGNLSSRVADAYQRESESVARTPSRQKDAVVSERTDDKDSKIPVGKVLEMAAQGGDELQIARQLGLGRDEVAMVLNLARLAHKGESL